MEICSNLPIYAQNIDDIPDGLTQEEIDRIEEEVEEELENEAGGN